MTAKKSGSKSTKPKKKVVLQRKVVKAKKKSPLKSAVLKKSKSKGLNSVGRRALAEAANGVVGQCMYLDGGVQKCMNTTQAWCEQRLKGTWDGSTTCPE